MRGLKSCLWVAGLLFPLSAIGLILPWSAIEGLAALFGVAPLPEGPLVHYAVRAMLATYAAVGVYFWLLARDPLRYGVLVPFSGLAGMLVGVTCGVTGAVLGLPTIWYLADFLGCTIIGVLILIFWWSARPAEGPAPAPAEVAQEEPEDEEDLEPPDVF